jgi:methionyl aminopeptidase
VIILKSPEEIAKMRRAGRIVAATINAVTAAVRPGLTTRDLDEVAEKTIMDEGATPSFKGYRGFPASICASVNEEVVHGIPGARTLKAGDILSLDFGAVWEGYHADSAVTVFVGEAPSAETEKLVRVTEEALDAGISQVRAGNRLSDISNAVQHVVEGAGFAVVREYVGHGVGRNLHEDPQIPNYGPPGRGPELKPGLVVAIEPMVNMGGWETRVLADGWTVVTADGSLSAHFEHTIAVTEEGPEVLTVRS